MSARAASGRTLLAAALARAEAWLLEPLEPAAGAETPTGPHPVVSVFGLGPRCGATTVARALAVELGSRAGGAAAVTGPASAGATLLATGAASRLARVLAEIPAARTRPVGRLCLVEGAEVLTVADTARHHAPLVLDAGAVQVGGVAASVADATVLVTAPSLEPSLADVAAECLARVGPDPILVLNRSRGEGEDGWHLALPESRAGAQLALGGRAAPGRLGAAVTLLATEILDRAT